MLTPWAALHSDAAVATYPSPHAHHPCPTYPSLPSCTHHMVCPIHVPCVCSPVRAGAWLALSDMESTVLRTLPVRSRQSVLIKFINGWNTIIPVKTNEDADVADKQNHLLYFAMLCNCSSFFKRFRDIPGTSPSNAGRARSVSGWGARIPRASQPKKQNIKQKQYCNRFSKDFQNGPH